MSRFHKLAHAVTVVAALSALGCGGELGPEDLDRLESGTGDNQTAPAGTAVPQKPSVLAVDKGGTPIPGVTVTFQVASGGGSVNGATATSNAQGVATIGDWILGDLPGPNVLSANAPGASLALTFNATGIVGPAAIIETIEGGEQTATAGRPLPVRPRARVTDQVGNVIVGVVVALEISAGGGSLVQSSSFSDPDGVITVIGWTLGDAPGTNTLLASVQNATGTITATGISGPVALVVAAGDSQVGTVGAITPVAPQAQVLDAQGLGVPDVAVSFSVLAGGGSLDADTAITDANGIAQVLWTLGTIAGDNTVFAQVGDLAVLQFAATGTPGPAAMLTPFSGNDQIAAVNQVLTVPPAVLVGDQFNNPVAATTVSFAVTGGGGTITGSPAVSDSNGIATLGSWTMGPTAGQNTVEATSLGLPPLTLVANALSSVFGVEIVRIGGGGPAVTTAINSAVARWTGLIIGDLPDVSFVSNPDSTSCGALINDVVDDVRIILRLEDIDGPGGVLGSAGPCLIRSGGGLTVVGAMRFDNADLDNLAAQGLLDVVIMHEMGHVFGIGTLWGDKLVNPSLPDNVGADTHFNGPRAIAAFDAVGGANFSNSKVPVENTQGGQGTRDGHWRESVFVNEFMTGFINSGFNPISVVTVESLGDIGYVVNSNGADAYTVPNPTSGFQPAAGAPGIELMNDLRRGPIYTVDESGRIVATVRQSGPRGRN